MHKYIGIKGTTILTFYLNQKRRFMNSKNKKRKKNIKIVELAGKSLVHVTKLSEHIHVINPTEVLKRGIFVCLMNCRHSN